VRRFFYTIEERNVKKIKVYIPSLGRSTLQQTFNELRNVGNVDVKIIISPKERGAYAFHNGEDNLITCPPGVQGHIGRVRHWIINHHLENNEDPRMVMMDDDLTFSTRREDDRTKAFPSTKHDLENMMGELRAKLSKFAHGGILAREGANRLADSDIVFNTRVMRVLAVDAAEIVDRKIDYTRCTYMEDFDVTLQLLRQGMENFVLCDWWHNQPGSNAAGGCSAGRTLEKQAAAAHKLAKLHPDFVTVVQKETKTSWGGAVRTDVRIAWKKALGEKKRERKNSRTSSWRVKHCASARKPNRITAHGPATSFCSGSAFAMCVVKTTRSRAGSPIIGASGWRVMTICGSGCSWRGWSIRRTR